MIVCLLGPTCSGKSAIAIEICKLINGVILNADPFQCYKELNIGTAKPSKDDFKKVNHYLYNIISIQDELSIFSFQKIFRNQLDNLIKENKNIVIVSGSGLYLKSALFDYEFVTLNNEDKSKYDDKSNEELYDLLKLKDPEASIKIHPNNRKRLIQALVINDNLGSNLNKSEFEKRQKHECIYKDLKFVGINLDRELLYQKINHRVDDMFSSGLENEVRELFEKYNPNLRAFEAIGYKEFKKEDLKTSEIKDLIKKNTRNYAKRQMTFFKHQFNDVKWFNNKDGVISYIKELYESKN